MSRRRIRLADVRAQAHPGEDRLDRVGCPQVDPVLGRVVVEGREVVPVAEQGLGRRVLAAGVEPVGKLVAAQLALAPGWARSRPPGVGDGARAGDAWAPCR